MLSGEKPIRTEHIDALPDDVRMFFHKIRAERAGYVVTPKLSRHEAIAMLTQGLLGLLQDEADQETRRV